MIVVVVTIIIIISIIIIIIIMSLMQVLIGNYKIEIWAEWTMPRFFFWRPDLLLA